VTRTFTEYVRRCGPNPRSLKAQLQIKPNVDGLPHPAALSGETFRHFP
jgi:hypothetical protein